MGPEGQRLAELERQVEVLRAALAEAEARLEAAAAQTRQNEERGRQLAAIVEASRDAIWSWTPDGTITSWNAAAERLLQYTADEMIGRHLLTLVPSERLELARNAMSELRRGGWIGQYETVRLRRDGTPIQVELTVSPIIDATGATVGAATICRDITQRKQLEARQELLVGELNHRFKNTISVIQALMHQVSRNSESLDDFIAAFGDRLRTLVRTHDALMRKQFEGASLRDLAQEGIDTFCSEGARSVTLKGDDLLLNPQTAQTVCLVFHELAANAARHGALSAAGGRVRLEWQVQPWQGVPSVRLEWHERGGPGVAAAPSRHGFGRTLLERGAAAALGGEATLEFARQGLRYELAFPVEGNVVSS